MTVTYAELYHQAWYHEVLDLAERVADEGDAEGGDD
jgi:hypothetical protein